LTTKTEKRLLYCPRAIAIAIAGAFSYGGVFQGVPGVLDGQDGWPERMDGQEGSGEKTTHRPAFFSVRTLRWAMATHFVLK